MEALPGHPLYHDYNSTSRSRRQSPHGSAVPRKGLAAIDLGEVFASRNLLYLFFWRDIKTRYKQSYLGVVWIVLSPSF